MITVEPHFYSELPDSIRPAWADLWSCSHLPKFQYDFNYMKAWSVHLRGNWRPFLLFVKDNEKIIGIFPLMYQNEKRRGIVPYRRVRFLGSTNTDFSVVLAAEADTPAVVKAGLDWLFSGKLRWELLILDDLVEGNPAVDAIKGWLEENRVQADSHEGKYYFINLNRSWDDIWQETSKKFVRRNMNLAQNRITKAGDWQVVINPSWDVTRLLDMAAPMHIERQTDLDRASFFNNSMMREFLLQVLNNFREKGLFRSYWLQFNDIYIAYMFGFEEDGIYYAWNMAFDPQFSHFFPSKFLLLEIIKECHQRGLKEFSFSRGETSYKEKWAKYYRINYKFTVKNTKSIYGKTVALLEKIIK